MAQAVGKMAPKLALVNIVRMRTKLDKEASSYLPGRHHRANDPLVDPVAAENPNPCMLECDNNLSLIRKKTKGKEGTMIWCF